MKKFDEELQKIFHAASEILNQPYSLNDYLKGSQDEWGHISGIGMGKIIDVKEKNAGENDCDHGVIFDEEDAKKINDPYEIRKKYPRGDGLCPKGCGYCGIAYASYMHYLMGDY